MNQIPLWPIVLLVLSPCAMAFGVGFLAGRWAERGSDTLPPRPALHPTRRTAHPASRPRVVPAPAPRHLRLVPAGRTAQLLDGYFDDGSVA